MPLIYIHHRKGKAQPLFKITKETQQLLCKLWAKLTTKYCYLFFNLEQRIIQCFNADRCWQQHKCKLIRKTGKHDLHLLFNNFLHGIVQLHLCVIIICHNDTCIQCDRSLTHWGWVMHICIIRLIIIGSDNGLWPRCHLAIIWTNSGILLIGPLATNFSEILIKINTFLYNKMHWKMSSGKCRPFCFGVHVLNMDCHSCHSHCQRILDNIFERQN